MGDGKFHAAGAGTKLTCPKCKRAFGSITKDVRRGVELTPRHFKFEAGYEFLNGDLMMTKCCGHFWFDGRSLHTEFGWVPPLVRSE